MNWGVADDTRAGTASRVATFGLFLGIALCGSADAVTSATRLGPEGGSISWIRTSGRHVYAFGYREGNHPTPGVGGNAWVSADIGTTWHPATAGELAALPKDLEPGTVRHPSYRRVLYRIIGRAPNWSFQVSTDGGATFRTRSRLRGKNAIRDFPGIVVLPTRPAATVLLVEHWTDSTVRSRYLRSTDGGRTWATPETRPKLINSVTAVPGSATVLYMTAASTSGFGTWLYRSRDAGATWELSTRRKLPGDDDDARLVLNPWRPDDMLLEGGFFDQGVFRSRDRGAHWERTLSGYVSSIVVDRAHPGVIYGASEAGIVRSSDLGRTWITSNAGIRNAEVRGVSIRGGRIYVNGQLGTGQVATSTDGGASWSTVPTGELFVLNGVRASAVAVDNTDSRRILVSGAEGLAWSDDTGANWHQTGIQAAALTDDMVTGEVYALTPYGRVMVAPHVGDPFTARGVAPMMPGFAFVASAGTLYATGGQGLFGFKAPHFLMRSFDGGRTWSRSASITGDVVDVALAPSEPMTAYIREQREGIDVDALLVTRNGGTSWSRLPLRGLPSTGVTTIAVDATNPLRLYAGASRPGIWTSADGGITWTRLSSEPRLVSMIVQNPGNTSQLFVGTWGFGFWRVDKDVL